MAAPRTTTRTSARERARARRLELDAARARRDEQLEEAAAQFYDAVDECETLAAQIEQAEQSKSSAIQALLDLDEKPDRIMALLDIDAAELRRLRPRTSRPASRTPRAADVVDDAGALGEAAS